MGSPVRDAVATHRIRCVKHFLRNSWQPCEGRTCAAGKCLTRISVFSYTHFGATVYSTVGDDDQLDRDLVFCKGMFYNEYVTTIIYWYTTPILYCYESYL